MPHYLTTAFLARLAEEGMGVALALLALHRTGSPAEGAFVLTAWMAPHVLAAPLVGALPTRWYGAALAVFAAAIAALALTVGRAPLPLTVAIAVAGGSCGPVVAGGLSGLVATLTAPGEHRSRAYGLDAAVYNAASVAAPATVGALAALASPGGAALALAASAATAALLATALPGRRAVPAPPAAVPPAPREHTAEASAPAGPTRGAALRAELAAGLAVVWRVRELRAVTAATTLAFLGVGGLTTTSVLLAEDRSLPGGGSAPVTLFALGALTGALATARLRTHVFTLAAGLKITAASAGAALTGLTATALPAPTLLLAIATLHLAAAALYLRLRHGSAAT
ncbi:MFS transporter [Streptomyces sp. XM4011]|uniref:MFS transporter n=1 Tax=Streptomyces sp. XM4011 TaxID=2929780 RepID=UPI001FF74837|nr:MFS transporter [Streptomyces sp. XM4011]MCK1814171.1 MFS transporter [Streptomyces sp. XM4011]